MRNAKRKGINGTKWEIHETRMERIRNKFKNDEKLMKKYKNEWK